MTKLKYKNCAKQFKGNQWQKNINQFVTKNLNSKLGLNSITQIVRQKKTHKHIILQNKKYSRYNNSKHDENSKNQKIKLWQI